MLLIEYIAHYHVERIHQGIGNDLIAPANDVTQTGRVQRRKRIGGLLSYYHREAA